MKHRTAQTTAALQSRRAKNPQLLAALTALLAALFYSVNPPLSKRLLEVVPPTLMAAFTYLGAGFGVGVMYLFRLPKEPRTERLTKKEWPYMLAVIGLDIAASILLTLGIKLGTASNASLLGNFEIVATSVIALLLFKERVSGKLWLAIVLITVSSLVLSFEGADSLHFSVGSLLVILGACCWGMDNNCTRKISDKSTYQIVTIKGLGTGTGSIVIALLSGERFPAPQYVLAALLLGFVSYGLSIFLYVRAQKTLGAPRTCAYYAVTPFVGTFLAFLINGEQPTVLYFVGLAIMLAGSAFVVWDTLHPSGAQKTAEH